MKARPSKLTQTKSNRLIIGKVNGRIKSVISDIPGIKAQPPLLWVDLRLTDDPKTILMVIAGSPFDGYENRKIQFGVWTMPYLTELDKPDGKIERFLDIWEGGIKLEPVVQGEDAEIAFDLTRYMLTERTLDYDDNFQVIFGIAMDENDRENGVPHRMTMIRNDIYQTHPHVLYDEERDQGLKRERTTDGKYVVSSLDNRDYRLVVTWDKTHVIGNYAYGHRAAGEGTFAVPVVVDFGIDPLPVAQKKRPDDAWVNSEERNSTLFLTGQGERLRPPQNFPAPPTRVRLPRPPPPKSPAPVPSDRPMPVTSTEFDLEGAIYWAKERLKIAPEQLKEAREKDADPDDIRAKEEEIRALELNLIVWKEELRLRNARYNSDLTIQQRLEMETRYLGFLKKRAKEMQEWIQNQIEHSTVGPDDDEQQVMEQKLRDQKELIDISNERIKGLREIMARKIAPRKRYVRPAEPPEKKETTKGRKFGTVLKKSRNVEEALGRMTIKE